MIRSAITVTQKFVAPETLGKNAIESKKLWNSSTVRNFHRQLPLRQPIRPRREAIMCRQLTSLPPYTEKKIIRLSKRMGELDMFSRREADRLILDGRVRVDGKLVEVGHKVPSDLQANQIEIMDKTKSFDTYSRASDRMKKNRRSSDSIHNTNRMSAVVLNKPKGYVSGQAEHGHPPAIRLLTSRNRIWGKEDMNQDTEGSDYDDLSYDARHQRHFYDWKGYAPAGRLDLDSTGLLLFTKNGVLAKKLIGAASSVEKEYIADVEPAVCPTKRELSMNPNFVLPSVSCEERRYDLSPILKGGGLLLGDNRPLKACPEAEWIIEGEKLRLVLTEGRKHQIRRMCRELLGFHVVGLRRVRIGPVVLPSKDSIDNENALLEGSWRPLRQSEFDILLQNTKQ